MAESSTECESILEAARMGDLKAVKQFLTANPESHEEVDAFGLTALTWAARKGQEAMAKLLLQQGADFKAVAGNGATALQTAAVFGHETVARLLLQQGAELEAADQRGRTALHSAAANGHEAVAQLLLEQGADIKAITTWGRTALHLAAESGQELMARLLLQQGAEAKALTTWGRTALHFAAANGHEVVARLLLEQGADIQAVDIYGATALHVAAYGGHEAVARLLLQRGSHVEALESDGSTALHLAAALGHAAVARLLLEHGADVGAVESGGKTPVDLALEEERAKVLGMLRPVHVSLMSGLSACCDSGDRTVQELLEEAEKKLKVKISHLVNIQDHQQLKSHLTLAEADLSEGGDVTAIVLQDAWSCQAGEPLMRSGANLHKATACGDAAAVKRLLADGADVKATDQHGRTALHCAAEMGQEAVAKVLLEHCADIDAAGPIPSVLAADHGHDDLAKLLARGFRPVAEVHEGILMVVGAKTALHYQPRIEILDWGEGQPELPDGQVPASALLKLVPEGISFPEPVRLLIPSDPRASTAWRSEGGGWQEVPSLVQHGYTEVFLDHFCLLVAARSGDPSGSASSAGYPGSHTPKPPPQAASSKGRRPCPYIQRDQPQNPVPQPNSAAPKPVPEQRRHLMLSGRFNCPERVAFIRDVRAALEAKGIPTYMVEADPGERFSQKTMEGMFRAKKMVAFCTQDYGAKTGARYETFWELNYAWEKCLPIIAVKLCQAWPPRPLDSDGGDAGMIQNDFVLSNSLLYIDVAHPVHMSIAELADEIERAWLS